METLRLRKIQQPSQVERLLETFVARGNLLPKDCYQIPDSRALSPQLQRILAREVQKGHVWSCWGYGLRIWLFIADMSLELSRERGAPVLQLNVCDDAGELK